MPNFLRKCEEVNLEWHYTMKQKLQTLKDSLGAWVVHHAEGKNAKWWLFGVLVYVAFLSVRRKSLCVRMLEQKMYARVRYAWFTQGSCRIFDVMQEMMRTGILHPKLCA